MNYKDFVVVSDIDDTIEDLLGAWCKWLNEKYDFNVQPCEIKEWDMTKAYPALAWSKIFEPLNYKYFWKDWVQPKKDAIKYLKKLYGEGFNIYLCTSTNYKNVAMKYEYIVKRYFPYIDWEHVIVAQDKHMIKCDFIIDDAVHNLIDCDGCIRILMSAYHNESFDAEKNMIYRAKNWKEIYDILHYYANQRIELDKKCRCI